MLAPNPRLARAATEIPIEKMRVAVGNVPSFVYAGFYVGLDRGYYAARGLEVELVLTRGGMRLFRSRATICNSAAGHPTPRFLTASNAACR